MYNKLVILLGILIIQFFLCVKQKNTNNMNNQVSNNEFKVINNNKVTNHFLQHGSIRYDLFNKSYDDTAKILSGLKIKKEYYHLHKIYLSSWYLKYKNELDNIWNKYLKTNTINLKNWSKLNLKPINNKIILYPFSGPDSYSPIAFFENGKDFILFGEHSSGVFSNKDFFDHSKIKNKMNIFIEYIKSYLKIDQFFKTAGHPLSFKLKDTDIFVTTMIFFLSRLNYTILYIRKIFLNKKNQIIPFKKNKNNIEGLEIVFKENKTSFIKRLRYFTISMNNNFIRKNSQLVDYFTNYQSFTTIVRSSFYQLHKDDFSFLRNIILSKSIAIIQDDSGIPIKFYNLKNWDISYFGYYHKPLAIFQKSLHEQYLRKSITRLPFQYGHYRQNESNLIYVHRKKGN